MILVPAVQVFPAMSADASVAPFAARALQPLSGEGAPLTLRCLALKLVVEGWLLTGRGWQRVEAALNGYAPHLSVPHLQLRITRAHLIRYGLGGIRPSANLIPVSKIISILMSPSV